MAYDVSKKINVNLAKIYTQLADYLYLRKTDAEKQYLALSGGMVTGDVTFDQSSLAFKNNSDISKITLGENGDFILNSDGEVRFSRNNNQYFVANPSYISLNNQHNPISIEIVNGEGADSPYGGFNIYDNSDGRPGLISAMNSGYMADIPYQEFMLRDEGNFVWSFIGDDVHEVAKMDKNGFTLLNRNDDNNELSALRFQSASGDIASISSVSGDMRLEAQEIILNNVATVGNDSLDLIGGKAIEFDSANDGVKMYSTANSNTLTIDVKGKKLAIDENGFSGNAASATKAEKLSAERTVSGGSDIVLNYKYDGSGDSTADVGFYACNAKVGNKYNYPYHRFAKVDLTSAGYEDWTTTLYISQGYKGGGFGICRISLRTNGVGVQSTAEVKWLCRNGLSADFIQIGIDNTIGATRADAFVKINTAYSSTTIRAFASESRGTIEKTWTLIDSEEVNNTDAATKHNSIECYKTIADAATELYGKAYSEVVVGEDAVAQVAVNDSGGRNINSSYITSIEANGANSLKITYGNGRIIYLNIPTS